LALNSVNASLEPLFDALHGRSIAVVGNAASLCDQRHGAAIEAASIVVRMNRAIPPAAETHGTRTDVLAFSRLAKVQDAFELFNARWVIWMSPKARPETPPAGILYYPRSAWEELHATLGSRPSTGLMTLDLLSRMSPGQVDVFGFDFKATNTFFHDRFHVGPHDFAQEALYARKLCADRGWTLF
jgi:hypothetical protein